MKDISVDATIENLEKVVEFINTELESFDCNSKTQMEIAIAVDEIFSNISHYAYGDKVGQATILIGFDKESKEVTLRFIDKGVPYNPLDKEDPDVSLSADERHEGGLGIYIVKKTMDKVEYEYKDNQNILTIKKKI